MPGRHVGTPRTTAVSEAVARYCGNRPEGRAMSGEIRLTRVKKRGSALLCKRIFLDEEGRVQSDGSPCAMSNGTATRVRLNGSPAAGLSNEILDLGPYEALVLGDIADGLPDKIKIEK